MSAQKGKDILLKVDELANGSFVTLAGIRTSRLSFNADTVDATTAESAGQWRELLIGAGVKSAAIAGSGIFKDDVADAALRRIFFDDLTPDFEVLIPDFGTITGPFQVTALEYSGNHDGEATFEIALASAGALTFAAI